MNETICPRGNGPYRPHQQSLRLEGGRVFLNTKNPGQGDIFAILWRDPNRNTEVFWDKNPPAAEGYPKDKIREILVWCEVCNNKTHLKQQSKKALDDLLSRSDGPDAYLKVLTGGSISTLSEINIPISENIGILSPNIIALMTDAAAEPGFKVWPYGEGNILERCWNRGWWEAITEHKLDQDAYSELEEEARRKKIAEYVTEQRFNRFEGRRRFITFFGDPKYAGYIREQMKILEMV